MEIRWLAALELWDLIVSVFGNISRISDRTARPVIGEDKHHKSHNEIDAMKDIDSVPSNVQSARQEALLYVFEDNEAVIKMIIKGRSPTMRHVSRTHRVALDWLFDRINLDSKIQIKYIDTKNQLEDILTKGNFTRDEWNHLLNLLNISHFSSTACTAAMAKRAQQGSGEERVTAKSRPMMNLTARMPSVVSSSTSANPGRSSYGYQDPEQPVLDDRTGKNVEPSRPDKTQDDYGRSWSSQEWKSGAAGHDRRAALSRSGSGRPNFSGDLGAEEGARTLAKSHDSLSNYVTHRRPGTGPWEARCANGTANGRPSTGTCGTTHKSDADLQIKQFLVTLERLQAGSRCSPR